MFFRDSVFLSFILTPAIIGICLTVLLLITIRRANNKHNLRLRSYAQGFGVCVATNIMILIVSMGFLGVPSYIIICGPLFICSFMLSKKLIQDTKTRYFYVNLLYKSITIIMIWFMAFFPFSLLGLIEMKNIPANNARNQEIRQFKEEIIGSETFADLTPFGLGIYKLAPLNNVPKTTLGETSL